MANELHNNTQQRLRFQTLIQFLFDYRISSFLWKFASYTSCTMHSCAVDLHRSQCTRDRFFHLLFNFSFCISPLKNTPLHLLGINSKSCSSRHNFQSNISVCIAIWQCLPVLLLHRSYFMVCLFVLYAIFLCCCFILLKSRNYKIRRRINCNNIASRSNRIYEECKYSVNANGSQINTSEMHLTRTLTHRHTQLAIPTHQQQCNK